MTVKEAAKDIVDYFNLDITDHGKIHLENILSNIYITLVYKPIKERIVYIAPPVMVDVEQIIPTEIELNQKLTKICEFYGADFKECFIPCRKFEVVQARVHFSREMKIIYPKMTCVFLASYFKKDHTTILNYWHHSKSPVKINPLPLMNIYNNSKF